MQSAQLHQHLSFISRTYKGLFFQQNVTFLSISWITGRSTFWSSERKWWILDVGAYGYMHIWRERRFPSKGIFFLPATEMQSVRQCSFQLNSNLSAIFWFNFTSVPRVTWETCHSCLTHLKSRLTLTASNLWPVLKHADPACNIRHSVKSRWRGFSFGVWGLLPAWLWLSEALQCRCIGASLQHETSQAFPSLISASASGTSLYTKKGNISSVPNVGKIW